MEKAYEKSKNENIKKQIDVLKELKELELDSIYLEKTKAYKIFNDKKYKLEQATARYNESAAVLFGFWFFNVAQSWLVPWLNSGFAPFSAQLDMRPVYGSQELLAGSARWEKYASFGWKNQF
ncbi:MAG TPA: hypothetical protein PKK94_22885, partial [Leptospiraceae bacterium]|nr:hypothetical protein [Leptospiraceae bacterium]